MKKNGEFQLRIGIFLLNPKSCCCKSQLENDDDSSATFPCSFIYVIALCAIPWCHHIFQHNKHALKLPNDINIPKRIYFPENFLWVLVCFFLGYCQLGLLCNFRKYSRRSPHSDIILKPLRAAYQDYQATVAHK